MAIRYDEPKSAPSIDFSRWLLEHTSQDTFVFVKMDIEGAEYCVIDHLMKTGAIDRIDLLAVEWHARRFPEPFRSDCSSIEARIKEYARDHPIVVLDWYW